MFIFILLFQLLVVNSLTTLQLIQSNIYDHNHLESAAEICQVILARLSHRGIFIHSNEDCVHTQIESEFGSTIEELYRNYERIGPQFLKKAQATAAGQRAQVGDFCKWQLLFKHGLEEWTWENVPDLPINECYDKQIFHNTRNNCTVIDTSTFPWFGSFALEPFDFCIQNLEELSDKRLRVRDVKEQQRTLPIILDMEISNVWHKQMPYKLLDMHHKIHKLRHP